VDIGNAQKLKKTAASVFAMPECRYVLLKNQKKDATQDAIQFV
jgi:hypothetical protein